MICLSYMNMSCLPEGGDLSKPGLLSFYFFVFLVLSLVSYTESLINKCLLIINRDVDRWPRAYFINTVAFQRLSFVISDVAKQSLSVYLFKDISICLPSKYHFCRSNSQLQHWNRAARSVSLVKGSCEHQKYPGIQTQNVRESIRKEKARDAILIIYVLHPKPQFLPADMPYFGPVICCFEFFTQNV